MRSRASFACAALILGCLAGCTTGQAGSSAPQLAAGAEDVTDAAACGEISALMLAAAATPGSELAKRLDESASFWREWHAALEPDESVRDEQTLAAAQSIVAKVEAAPADAGDIAMLEILAECQEKRAELTSGEGE